MFKEVKNKKCIDFYCKTINNIITLIKRFIKDRTKCLCVKEEKLCYNKL